jgi:AraC-like DNA-binding protein
MRMPIRVRKRVHGNTDADTTGIIATMAKGHELVCHFGATTAEVDTAIGLAKDALHEFIKTIRLRKSIRYLPEGALTVSQVAYEVGFNSHSYFDKCFIKQYKMGPKEYINRRKGKVT